MKRLEVLEIFYADSHPLTPDSVRRKLWALLVFPKRCSVYSYLLRLQRQGLLHRTFIRGQIAYAISDRGIARLKYLREIER